MTKITSQKCTNYSILVSSNCRADLLVCDLLSKNKEFEIIVKSGSRKKIAEVIYNKSSLFNKGYYVLLDAEGIKRAEIRKKSWMKVQFSFEKLELELPITQSLVVLGDNEFIECSKSGFTVISKSFSELEALVIGYFLWIRYFDWQMMD